MKKLLILFLALLSLSVIDIMMADNALCLDAAQRKAFIATLPKGNTFENDGMTYVWLPTLRGEKKAASSGKTVESAVNGRQTVEQKGGYTIYKPVASGATASQAASGNTATAHRIALNVQTQSLAVVTGKLWLKLKDINDARPIADEYGLAFSHVFTPMMTAFYQAPDGADLEALRKKLLADARVKRVTLDMVDRIRQPH